MEQMVATTTTLSKLTAYEPQPAPKAPSEAIIKATGEWLMIFNRVYGMRYDENTVAVWASIFDGVNVKSMTQVIMDYAKSEEKKPSPALLMNLYRNYRQWYKSVNREPVIASDGTPTYKCPYCRDTGWVTIEVKDIYRSAVSPCNHDKSCGQLKELFDCETLKWSWGDGRFNVCWAGDKEAV